MIFLLKIWNFCKFFIKSPSLKSKSCVKHAKWQIQRVCIIVSLSYWPGEAAKQAASWFLPPSVCLGLKLYCTYRTEVSDRFSMQKVKGDKDSEQSDRLGGNSVYAYLFPNMMINRYGPWMDTNIVIPKSEIIPRLNNLQIFSCWA